MIRPARQSVFRLGPTQERASETDVFPGDRHGEEST